MAKSKLHTKLCDLLGIEYPIIQAGMGGLRKQGTYASPHLCAAASNAGGLGMLGCSRRPPEVIRQWIREVREKTDKPFGADITMPSIIPAKEFVIREMVKNIPKQHLAWQADFMKRHNIPHPEFSPTFDCPPFTKELSRQQIEVLLEERVPVIAVAIGDPGAMTKEAHQVGTKVIGLVGNVKTALREAASGVDVLVATGTEAGGHCPRIGGLAVLPQVIDAVHAKYPDILICYAGGIADGRQIAAVLTMGAVGVWIGTRFLASTDADLVEDWYKKAIVDANDEGSIRFEAGDGMPLRVLKPWVFYDEFEKAKLSKLSMVEQQYIMAHTCAGAEEAGITDIAVKTGGQSAGLIKDILSAKEIMDKLVGETIESLEGVPKVATWSKR